MSLSGVLASGIFELVGHDSNPGRPTSSDDPSSVTAVLHLSAGGMAIGHAVLQTVVVLACLRFLQRSTTANRPLTARLVLAILRETVAFLALTNVALWIVDVTTVDMSRTDVEMQQQSSVAKVISLVCVPVGVFHRFIATVCMATLWKHLY